MFWLADSQNTILWDETQQAEVKRPCKWMRISPGGWQLRILTMDVWHILLFDLVRIKSHRAWIYHWNQPPSRLALSAPVSPTILAARPWNFDNESCKSSEWFSESPDPTMMYKNTAEVCHNLRFSERYDTQRRKLKFPVPMNYLVELSHLGCTLRRSQTSVWLPHLLGKGKEQRRSGSYIRISFVLPFFYGNTLALLLLSATTCRFWKRREMGWGEVDWDRGGDEEGGERWM